MPPQNTNQDSDDDYDVAGPRNPRISTVGELPTFPRPKLRRTPSKMLMRRTPSKTLMRKSSSRSLLMTSWRSSRSLIKQVSSRFNLFQSESSVPEAYYTTEEVAQHNTEDDCWVIVGNEDTGGAKVYDVTDYLEMHPAGPDILMEVAGTNADEAFEDIGHSAFARKTLAKYIIGAHQPTEEELAAMAAANAEDRKSLGSVLMVLLVVVSAVLVAYKRELI